MIIPGWLSCSTQENVPLCLLTICVKRPRDATAWEEKPRLQWSKLREVEEVSITQAPTNLNCSHSCRNLYAHNTLNWEWSNQMQFTGKIKTCSAWYIKCLESNISTLCETVKCLKVISSTMSNSVLSVHRKGAVVFFCCSTAWKSN